MFSEEFLVMAQKVGIEFPTILPLYSSPPNEEHLLDWAESQVTPMLRQIAHTIVTHINYISFEPFLSQLQRVIDDFHEKIQNEPYFLLIPEWRADKLKQGCSDLWVAGLAFEYCHLKLPVAMRTLTQWSTELYRSYPNVHHVLLLDDAAYSGSQKQDALDRFEQKLKEIGSPPCQLWLGLPFITHYAKNSLQKDSLQRSFLSHQIMPSVNSVLSSEEYSYAQQLNIGYMSDNITLTYFDHRFPDFYSAFQMIYDGSSLNNTQICDLMHFLGYVISAAQANDKLTYIADPEIYNNLVLKMAAPNYISKPYYNIPRIISPYYLNQLKGQELLCQAIADQEVGVRRDYQPSCEKLIKILDKPQLQAKEQKGYGKTQLTLDQQIGFDKAVVAGNWRQITYLEQQEQSAKQMEEVEEKVNTTFRAPTGPQFFQVNALIEQPKPKPSSLLTCRLL